jgi:hypothetical protein
MQTAIVSSSKLPNARRNLSVVYVLQTRDQASAITYTAEVRAQAALKNHANINTWRPPPVVFPDLDLLVKYGDAVSIAEGQCL